MLRALLAALLAFLLPTAQAAGSTSSYLNRIRDSPRALEEFMYELPKGGDLHNHLGGAVYAESMIGWGEADGLCIETLTFVSSLPPCTVDQRPIADALTDNVLYNQIVAAWSMRDFVPGVESGHDHFFASFDKFGATQSARKGDALAEVANRAAEQSEHYLELLYTAQFGRSNRLANQVGLSSDFAATREALLAGGMDEIVDAASVEMDGIYAQFDAALGCGTPAAKPGCELPIRFDYQVLRAMPPQVVFAMLVLGFELQRSDPRFVGVNLVQPEDALVALRDYRLQMRMIKFLRTVYDGEHVTLHAGELAPGLVPPSDLRFHINAAVRIAGAERIGHGVSIRHEHGAKQLLRLMARRHILAEQCLTSNEQVLGIEGRRNSFPVYRRFGVPIALCTDDEGVSRTDLTEQYLIATREYDLSYRELKRISRDSLRYGFLQPAAKREAKRGLQADFRAFERRYR
jgi:adenosine deaminase